MKKERKRDRQTDGQRDRKTKQDNTSIDDISHVIIATSLQLEYS